MVADLQCFTGFNTWKSHVNTCQIINQRNWAAAQTHKVVMYSEHNVLQVMRIKHNINMELLMSWQKSMISARCYTMTNESILLSYRTDNEDDLHLVHAV